MTDIAVGIDVLIDGVASPLSGRTRGLRVTDGDGHREDRAEWTLAAPADARLALPPLGVPVEFRARRGGAPEVLGGRLRAAALAGDARAGTVTVTCAGLDPWSSLRETRDADYQGLSLGAIAGRVADRAGLPAVVAPELAEIDVEQPLQRAESDRAFLERLVRRSGGVLVVKGGRLLVAPEGGAASATGAALAPLALDAAADGAWLSWRRAAPLVVRRVTARWLDADGSTQRVAVVGDGAPARALSTTYPTEAEALRAARAALDAYALGVDSVTVETGLRPDLRALWPVDVDGLPGGLPRRLVIRRAEHSVGGGAATTRIEARPPPP